MLKLKIGGPFCILPYLGPIFVQKDVVCAFFNHFVTLQSSEDRTQKKM